MIQEMLSDARAGKPVYITTVHEAFARLGGSESERIVCVVDLLDQEGRKAYELRIPVLENRSADELAFISEYLNAEIYNILSSIGGRCLTVLIDTENPALAKLAAGLDTAFCIGHPRKSRTGYGRAVNVIDRMISAVRPGEPSFRFLTDDVSRLPVLPDCERHRVNTMAFSRSGSIIMCSRNALRWSIGSVGT